MLMIAERDGYREARFGTGRYRVLAVRRSRSEDLLPIVDENGPPNGGTSSRRAGTRALHRTGLVIVGFFGSTLALPGFLCAHRYRHLVGGIGSSSPSSSGSSSRLVKRTPTNLLIPCSSMVTP